MPIPRSLHLTSLKLRNFKGIAELHLAFDESLTLLAGVNGVGKTSVMQALVAAVTHVWGIIALGDYPHFSFEENVVRAGATDAQIALGLGVPNASQVETRWNMEGTRLLLDGGSPGFGEILEKLELPLPLVVYYEQNRVAQPLVGGRNVLVSAEENRASSLQTTISSPSEFKAWFFEKEADESQEVRDRGDAKYEDKELSHPGTARPTGRIYGRSFAAIRGLLAQLDEFTAVRSRKTPDRDERTLFLEKDGANIPFDSLSGGEQAFFLLAADLARRLMLACPDAPVTEAPGIVCIDEIELHLHPAWQRRILGTLMEMFPACQFVVSTHSPQVIGGVEARHVRLLTSAENGVRKVSHPIASKGRDSNYVLKGILDTPERDDDGSHLFAEFDRLADAGELEEAERVLGSLDEAVEGQSSGVAIRQAKWNRLRRAAE